MQYRYECQLCNAEFFRDTPNANEQCRRCGKYCCLDWAYDIEEKSKELKKPQEERSPHYRDDGPTE